MPQVIEFSSVEKSDLVVDAIYKGGEAGHAGDDPINKLLSCGNQGGFRYRGSSSQLKCRLVVLYSSLSDPDWPDSLDVETGQFTYFGDNKKPGHLLHETPRKGNVILRDAFAANHLGMREGVPPFFVFTKGDIGRDVAFRGLAAPGASGISPAEDLVAIWKTKAGERFQNYKAVFTILDVPVVQRVWIDDLMRDKKLSEHCPNAWRRWVEEGSYTPLRAPKTIEHRTKEDQLPTHEREQKIIQAIYQHFSDSPHEFERCAAELTRLMDTNFVSYDLTRPWVDGGRDATGEYRIGLDDNAIKVDFALEAKCYGLDNAVGVRQSSRLISRLRYRQFGVLVTTSYLHHQAYRELKEDKHPVIVISAIDIVHILGRAGYNTLDSVRGWLASNFPLMGRSTGQPNG